MNVSISRRLFLALVHSLPACATHPSFAFADAESKSTRALEFGPATAFSFSKLQRLARKRAGLPYKPRPKPAPRIVKEIDYDAHYRIFQPIENSLFPAPDGDGAVTLLHLARLFPHPVRIHLLNDGVAREIHYRRRYFRFPKESPAAYMPDDAGFAGFRLHRQGDVRGLERGRAPDWMSFLGASYFRASGDRDQYGVSARGLAVDTAVPGKEEEFPAFTEFWIEKSGLDFHVYALLEGKSVAGAYSFVITRFPNVVTTVRATIFPRRDDIACLGLAPLTSMYWYSETNRWRGRDWRQEVHDSDGLLMHSGAGEWLWRPLNNPSRLSTSTFLDEKPRGFGLLQRDRASASYIDEVAYERRPNLWVEPLGDWPEGAIHLVEIPTESEYFDNIVAFFKRAEKPSVGVPIDISYRLHWNAEEILPAHIAPAVAFRTTKPWTRTLRVAESVPIAGPWTHARKVMIEFKGESLGRFGLASFKPVVEGATPGDGVMLVQDPDGDPNHLRLTFDVAGLEEDPTEVRAFLLGPDGPVTSSVLAQVWMT